MAEPAAEQAPRQQMGFLTPPADRAACAAVLDEVRLHNTGFDLAVLARGVIRAGILQRRTCAKCGGPYRSEMDSACAHCHTPRADAQTGWRLDRNYLVVQTGC